MRMPFAVEDFLNAEQEREFHRLITKVRPDLVKRFTLPKYAAPAGYRSYTKVSEMMAMNEVDLEARMESFGENAINSVAALVSASVWKQEQYQFPLCYVSRDIAEAANATELPDWMNFAEINWPLPAMTFMLPQGMFISPLGHEASALSVSHVTADETQVMMEDFKKKVRRYIPRRAIISVARIATGTIFIWCTMITPRGNWKMWGLDRPLVGNLAESVIDYEKLGDYVEGQEEEEDRDNEWWHGTMLKLAVNFLMFMGERPELVEPQRPLKRIGKKGKDPVTLWQPRWLGRTYRYKHEGGRPGEGTHASPRAHWRMGHWRQQSHGPKHTLRKRIWIEPIWVNPA